ncbi:hypothetical protein UY3_10291 [Chelonia mydas]|uniref:Uncharacterized protein n=1 Tax=Chelonia mydas TaxID=8469 RepID=M7B3W0_CHEMY|nr:hypothetical protein UY3_10291 [Chelonia mydas]
MQRGRLTLLVSLAFLLLHVRGEDDFNLEDALDVGIITNISICINFYVLDITGPTKKPDSATKKPELAACFVHCLHEEQPIGASWWGLGTRVDRQPPSQLPAPLSSLCSSHLAGYQLPGSSAVPPPLPRAAPALCLGAASRSLLLAVQGVGGKRGADVRVYPSYRSCPPLLYPISTEWGQQPTTGQDKGSLLAAAAVSTC